jgi:predicted nucleic acid-binding protein
MPDTDATSVRCFVDTNVWLYAFIEGDEPRKHAVARRIAETPGVATSVQVINETCVNLLKKTPMTEEDIRQLVSAFYAKYMVAELSQSDLLLASDLREKYGLSFWDSTIVASALASGCGVLYTEDMQDGLTVEARLMVVNPFAAARQATNP